MTRYAVLIEAGKAKNQTPLSGPAEDVRRLRLWMIGSSGGAWNDAEVETLSNPSTQQVTEAITRAGRAGYAFVSFSGHGYIEEDARTGRRIQKVTIGTGESIDFSSLRPKAKKCTLVCDACREVHKVTFFAEAVNRAIKYAREKEKYSRQLYRAWFDSALVGAADGVFTMYGCSPGQYCYEDPLTGGFFTESLIEIAASWASNATKDGCMPMQEVLNAAAVRVGAMSRDKKPPQNPHGGPENRTKGNAFPFAVALV
jgi:hypothetical protein